MRNGGGPACLRLRVTLTDTEWVQVNSGNKFTPALYKNLKGWIHKYYRENLAPEDIRDPAVISESFSALNELTDIMDLGSDFYPFQR